MNLLAQGTQPEINLSVPAGSGFENVVNLTFAQIVSYAIQLVLVVAALLFFFLLVLGGIKWITSGGDKGQTEAARNQITAALVGLTIVFAAWAITQLVETFFGISILGGLDINP
jgi:TRAP-type C4-dicarboxylate transport system permease small subunit